LFHSFRAWPVFSHTPPPPPPLLLAPSLHASVFITRFCRAGKRHVPNGI
jgi:hypothetical protein